eukprot:COSAG04_NODE_17112_length_479_cov_0.684211_2_plen_83_part_00
MVSAAAPNGVSDSGDHERRGRQIRVGERTSLGGEDQAVVDLAVELVGGVARPELVMPVADGVLLPRLSALLVGTVALRNRIE